MRTIVAFALSLGVVLTGLLPGSVVARRVAASASDAACVVGGNGYTYDLTGTPTTTLTIPTYFPNVGPSTLDYVIDLCFPVASNCGGPASSAYITRYPMAWPSNTRCHAANVNASAVYSLSKDQLEFTYRGSGADGEIMFVVNVRCPVSQSPSLVSTSNAIVTMDGNVTTTHLYLTSPKACTEE